jgi:3-hydroxymyristoyl/3-hydroxydecanoyl-(acyl carrier protein) dehydratase
LKNCCPCKERPKLTERRPIDTVVTLLVPGDHPALAGHFPGRPIVPGVLLIDAIARAARSASGWGPLARVVNAKFLRPISGDMAVSVSLRSVAEERVAYEARCGDDMVASGTLEFRECSPSDG